MYAKGMRKYANEKNLFCLIDICFLKSSKNLEMKKTLKLVGLVLLGVLIAPFVRPMLAKIPVIGPMIDKIGG